MLITLQLQNGLKYQVQAEEQECIATVLGRLFDKNKNIMLENTKYDYCKVNNCRPELHQTLLESGVSEDTIIYVINQPESPNCKSMLSLSYSTIAPNTFNDKICVNDITFNPFDFKIKQFTTDCLYFGQLLNGLKHGLGTCFYMNGNIYTGEFANDLPNGKGYCYLAATKDTYVGDYKDDKMNGKGIYKYNDGDIYDGDFLEDKMHGKGMIRYNCGDIYEGDWINDTKDGEGKFYYENGDFYIGEWKEDNKHGRGIMRKNDGSVMEGEWEMDEMVASKEEEAVDNGEEYVVTKPEENKDEKE